MNKLALLAVLSLYVGTANVAQAGVIDFEGHMPTNDGATVQFQDGYTFTFSASGWGIFLDDFVGGGAPYTSNGTERLVAAGNRDGNAQVDMAETGGASFSVFGLDAATMFPGFSTGSIDVTGNLTGGGTVSTTLNVTNSFSTFTLSGFTGLDSIVFSDTASGSFTQTPGLSLDNIRLEEAPQVPEPTSIAIFGFSMLGLAAAHRRRRAS